MTHAQQMVQTNCKQPTKQLLRCFDYKCQLPSLTSTPRAAGVSTEVQNLVCHTCVELLIFCKAFSNPMREPL